MNGYHLKQALCWLPVTLLLIGEMLATPLWSFGEGLHLFATTTGQVQVDDNISLDEFVPINDTVYAFQPGLELKLGTDITPYQMKLKVSRTIRRYEDEGRFDVDLNQLSFDSSIAGAKFRGNLSASFTERRSNSSQANALGTLIDSEVSSAAAWAEYPLFGKLKLGMAAGYDDTTFVNDSAESFPNKTIYSVPVRLFYGLSPKLDAVLQTRYRRTQIDELSFQAENNSTDYSVSLGVRGRLLPKLEGSIVVGYQLRDYDAVYENLAGLSTEVELEWKPLAKGAIRFSLHRDYTPAGSGETIEEVGASFSAEYAFTPIWSATVSGRFQRAQK
jgi:hypothetical protein